MSTTTGEGATSLLPKMFEDSGPGITSDPRNKSPFFSEQLNVTEYATLQLYELGADGKYYNLQITVPAGQESTLRNVAASMRTPPIATATDDVKLIQENAGHALSLKVASVGTSFRWILVGGEPATIQQPFALFRSADGGQDWALAQPTYDRRKTAFLSQVGSPTLLFWSGGEGVIAEASGFSPALWVFCTSDGGTTWAKTTLSLPSISEEAPVVTRSPGGTLAITVRLVSGKTYRASSTDGGSTWSAAG